jgi:FkbM family methyltransferase
MNIKSKLKFWKDVLIRKEVYFPTQIDIQKEWIGSEYGGFFVIPSLLNESSIIYSFGVGEDVSFDTDLIDKIGCFVYCFDPTPKSKVFIEKNHFSEKLHFSDVGIAAYDGTAKFFLPENPDYVSCTTYNRWGYDEQINKPIEVPVKKLETIMKEFQHDHIDLLKMDIEGSEYDTIPDIIKSKIPVKQLLIEVHHRFTGIGIKKTKEIFACLNSAGYKIAAISKSKEEYTFLKS